MGKIKKKIADFLEEKFPNHIMQGDEALANRKFDKAVMHYAELEKANRLNEYILCNWGLALQGLNKFEEAIEKYKQALEKKDTLFDAYINWGLCLFRLGNYDIADKVFSQLAEKNPEFPPLYFNWAVNKEAQQKYDEAMNLYLKAVEIAPSNFMALNAMGKLYVMKQDFNKAIELFEKAIKANTKFAPAYLSISILNNKLGNLETTLSYLKKAIQLDPMAKMIAVKSGEFANLADNETFQNLTM